VRKNTALKGYYFLLLTSNSKLILGQTATGSETAILYNVEIVDLQKIHSKKL
jgi:hypothetical protein